MKGRFNATRRMQTMAGVLALAEDLDGISIKEASERLDVPEDKIRECLIPLTDLEFVSGSEFIADLGNAITITDDTVHVFDNWWQNIGGLSPGEAARLITQIDFATAILGEHKVAALGRLRRRLLAVVGVKVHDPVPEKVQLLFKALDSHRLLRAVVASGGASLAPEPKRWEVHAVYQENASWRATVIDHDADDPQPVSVLAAYMHDLQLLFEQFDPMEELPSEQQPQMTRDPIEAVIEHERSAKWKLSYFEPVHEELGNDRIRSTVTVPHPRSLRQLVLRLGPGTKVISPEEYTNLPAESAQQILSRYGR